VGLGETLVKLKRYPEAEARLRRALSVMEKAFGKEHPSLAYPLMGLGEVWLERGKPTQALPFLHRALTLAPPDVHAGVRFILARTYWELGGKDRSRAVELAQEARDAWQRNHHPKAAEASKWLAAHSLH
jgi:tetratricopeptide (TPR) repeat protein